MLNRALLMLGQSRQTASSSRWPIRIVRRVGCPRPWIIEAAHWMKSDRKGGGAQRRADRDGRPGRRGAAGPDRRRTTQDPRWLNPD